MSAISEIIEDMLKKAAEKTEMAIAEKLIGYVYSINLSKAAEKNILSRIDRKNRKG